MDDSVHHASTAGLHGPMTNPFTPLFNNNTGRKVLNSLQRFFSPLNGRSRISWRVDISWTALLVTILNTNNAFRSNHVIGGVAFNTRND